MTNNNIYSLAQEPTPLSSPCTPQTEVTPIKDLVEEALKNLPVQQKTPYYDLEFMKLMGKYACVCVCLEA